MPPAKADLATFADQSNAAGLGNKQACLSCRKVKIRCLQHDGGQACSRCARLALRCEVQPHRRGPNKRFQARNATANDRLDRTNRSSTFSREALNGSPGLASPSHRHSSKDGHSAAFGSPYLPNSRLASHPFPRFSTRSLLDNDDTELRKTTLASNLIEEDELCEPNVASVHSYAVMEPVDALSDSDRPDWSASSLSVWCELFTEQEARFLHGFYFERLNGCIALLTPALNVFDDLCADSQAHLLLSAILTVSSRFVMVHKYGKALSCLDRSLNNITATTGLPSSMQTCQALTIAAMWRHPSNSTGWRKIHTSISIALEQGLDRLAKRPLSADLSREEAMRIAQLQRTFFQLGCTEEHFCNQRRIPALLDVTSFLDPRVWIESLGHVCEDVDVRIAAAIDQISIFRKLQADLAKLRAESSRAKRINSRSHGLQELRLLKNAIFDHDGTAAYWLQEVETSSSQTEASEPAPGSLRVGFANRPCGEFNRLNHGLNYWQAVYAVYCRKEMMADKTLQDERSEAFERATWHALALMELFDGPFGEAEYYRYVHDSVICSTAAASIWVVDNWRAMNVAQAERAHAALRRAARVTSSSADRWLEQSAYLHKLLQFCCSKLPSSISMVPSSSRTQENNQHGLAQRRESTEGVSAVAADWIMTPALPTGDLLDSPPGLSDDLLWILSMSLGGGTDDHSSLQDQTNQRCHPNHLSFAMPTSEGGGNIAAFLRNMVADNASAVGELG